MRRTVPLILAVALFMENMDSTVIATSLPAIAVDIGTSPIALKLALTAYLVALAIFIPVSAWVADRLGAKLVFRAAIGVFVIGSVACASSGSLLEFVLARFLQGMGGAMMTPVARLVLVRATEKSDLVSAMAWLTIPGLIGPLVGPPVGGFITTFITWHWIFLINVPIGLAGIWLAGRYLPDIEPAHARRLDMPGFLLSGIAASGVVFGLSVISLPALPPIVGVIVLLVGLGAGALYFRHARVTPDPILDLRLFRNPAFRAAVGGGALFRVGSGATPFLLPLLFQLGFGMTPFQSGMLTFASAFGAIAMKFMASFTLRAGGFRTVLAATAFLGGGFIAASALFTPSTSHAVIIAVLIGSGFLRSLFFTSAGALVFADIDAGEASQATAISAATQQISIAVGVAVGGGLLEGTSYLSGEPIGPGSFTVAFLTVGLITALSLIPFARLPKDAGSSVSGHRLRRPAGEEPPAA
ncbi:MAG: MFS transporter [Alphaproteobacteria bacterium]|nr:MFS transporter [Alphaproteobacteria bacterium]